MDVYAMDTLNTSLVGGIMDMIVDNGLTGHGLSGKLADFDFGHSDLPQKKRSLPEEKQKAKSPHKKTKKAVKILLSMKSEKGSASDVVVAKKAATTEGKVKKSPDSRPDNKKKVTLKIKLSRGQRKKQRKKNKKSTTNRKRYPFPEEEAYQMLIRHSEGLCDFDEEVVHKELNTSVNDVKDEYDTNPGLIQRKIKILAEERDYQVAVHGMSYIPNKQKVFTALV